MIRLFPSRKDLVFSVNRWGKQICAFIGKNPILRIPISKISKKEVPFFAQPPTQSQSRLYCSYRRGMWRRNAFTFLFSFFCSLSSHFCRTISTYCQHMLIFYRPSVITHSKVRVYIRKGHIDDLVPVFADCNSKMCSSMIFNRIHPLLL